MFNYLYIPPDKKGEYSSMIYSGNAAYICFDVFGAYGKNFLAAHRVAVDYLLKELIESPVVKTEGLPESARVTLLNGQLHSVVNVKATYPECKLKRGVIDSHITLPKGGNIFVKGEFTKAFDALTEKEISIVRSNGYTIVELPEIFGFLMVVLLKV